MRSLRSATQSVAVPPALSPKPILSAASIYAAPIGAVAGIVGLLALVTLGASGCGGDVAVAPHEPITASDQLYLRLTLDHRAINLSTAPSFNTFQLTATPLDATGAPITGLAAPTFRSTDTTTVQVSPDGILTAMQAGIGISIIAELRAAGNVRHADTAIVNVNATTDPPPVLANFSIDPVAPDSAIIGVPAALGFDGGFWTFLLTSGNKPLNMALRRRMVTAEGDPIPGLVTEYVSLDPAIATIDPQTGIITPIRPGTVRLVARMMVYGVSNADTTVFTVTPPYAQVVNVKMWSGNLSIFGPTILIRPSGVVMWFNRLAQPVDVVFDDPTAATQPPVALCAAAGFDVPDACGAGNFSIPGVPNPGNFGRARQFQLLGTYRYRDALTGAAGTIVVSNEGL